MIFLGTNSSDHQVNVVALSKVIISNILTFELSSFSCRIPSSRWYLAYWHIQMCITISRSLFPSIAADLLHIAQSIWAFVTTKNNLECRGDTWTFFAGTNFALRTARGTSKWEPSFEILMCFNLQHLKEITIYETNTRADRLIDLCGCII